MIENIRHYIRSRGYASAMTIVLEIIKSDSEMDLKLLEQIECDDIHRVEYTNAAVSSFRVNDLIYYNPNQ